MPDQRSPVQVTRTGIALVHEGELIYPAPGSEAAAEPIGEDGRVVYHFPVEIEVRATPERVDANAMLAETLGAVTQALRNG